jgi:Tol biopolymer transport system component/DNA-binding SARP family transcriptional activator
MIHFKLLGDIDLRGGDGTVLGQLLRQPKRLALLAYLAAPSPGTWHRRDTVLGLFWPEQDTAHARTSLRNALYVLRQTLGDAAVLSRGDEEISVSATELQTDLAAVWEAMRGRKPEEALRLYRGELLLGLYAPDSDGFQRWLDAERARLRIEVAKAGVEWAVKLEGEGRLEDAVGVARRVLEIHPDDEPAVRRLMELQRALGNRAGALAAFEEYRTRLAREFEAEPAPETIALAEGLRRLGDMAAPTATPRPPNVPPSSAEVAPAPFLDGLSLGAGPRRRTSNGRRPDVRRVVVMATGLLAIATLGWRLTRTPQPAALGRSSPVTFEEGLQIEPSISPNGRLVAYASGTSRRMRIFIHRIEGGLPWPLSGDSNSVEILPRWSPDNDAILFLSKNNAYVSAAVGGTARLIAAGGEGDAAVRSASWSPNGDSVAIVRNDSLMIRPLEGAGARFVGHGTQLHSCAWSPDGRWISCVSGNWIAFVPGTLFGNQAPSGIVLFPAAGGPSIDLTDREKAYQSPAWSADGRFLWLLSNLDGQWGEVYAVRVGRDGRRNGAFQRAGLRAESISLSEHRIVYSVYTRRANVWSIPIGSRTPASLADAVRVTSGNQIVEVLHASQDGNWLVYDSNLRGNSDIYRMPTGGGPSERLTDDPREEYGGDLSPDNRAVAFQLWTGGQRRLFIKDLTNGAVQEVVAAPGDQGVPRWSPDGKAITAWEHGSEPGSIFMTRRDSSDQWGSPVWSLAGAQLPVWSPDGTSIAFLRATGGIEMIPADSGASRNLYEPRAGSNDPIATFLAWDAGRPDIWFLGHDSTGSGGVWAMPLRGGTPRLVMDFRDEIGRVNGPTLASDGKRLYFTLDERFSNVRWAELVRR